MEDVIYTPDRSVVLDFKVDGLILAAARQVQALLDAGFNEVVE